MVSRFQKRITFSKAASLIEGVTDARNLDNIKTIYDACHSHPAREEKKAL